ncbi:hypothetical protein E1263_36195 [Kribbella antibiotica]|uniref:Uncharacterized protein n=1 Tax=Kribbella antibiotica TaxID=190195 RepID=A0A4R4YND7_9ACTN|nr:hypothetical protein [Kribbella antibiotica]TDD46556.1 hypothetical protein E1263_36195 [Kribbella antibiotica]
MSSSSSAGANVATAIGVMKWVLIGLAMVVALVSVINVVLSDDSTYRMYGGLAAAGGAVVWSLCVWVLFGWFEHTLSALVTIARNTTPVLMPSREVPAAPYEQHA